MKYFFGLLSFLLVTGYSYSQKNFTIQQATSGQRQDFAPQSLDWVKFRGKTHDYTYLVDYTTLMLASEKSAWQATTLSDLSKFKSAIKSFGAVADLNLDNITYFPYAYDWVSDSVMTVEAAGTNYNYVFNYNPFSNKLSQLFYYDVNAENGSYSPANNGVAYTVENNLYVREGSNTISVTSDEDKGIVNGQSVHRQEFGIDKGIFYSPKGNYVAYYRKDETMVAQYPLVNTSARIALVKNIRYPMAGEKSEEVTLLVFNSKTQQKTAIQTTGSKEQYLTSVTWDPTEKYIYVGVLNREQNHLQMNKYDAVTGSFVKTLFEEKHPKYVEPLSPLKFFATKPHQFIFQSQRDGFNHLYLYDTEGKLIKQLTKGAWIVTEIVGFDTKEENLYFISNMNEVLGRHLSVVNIKTGKITQITKVPGTHSGVLSKDGAFWVDYVNSTEILNTITLIDTKKGKINPILTSTNTYADINMPKLQMVELTAADGKTPLYGRMIMPPNMDVTKKYPVVVYVYGGPHAQMVSNEWLGGATLFEYYMAQQGYIMFTVDNRGSSGRGMDFENVIHRQLGQNEMADQMKGVEYLKSQSFVDANKIGVYGWSFGGFMTISLMLNHSDVFKVAVAGGPVCDWKYYEVMYGERYMDTPQENKDGYEKTSVINKADQLKGRLLIIHGAQDDVVVMQHSMEFINACIKKGKQVDYFLYPDHQHNVRGKDRVHLNTKIIDYFNTHLK
jgi:dipeptidyl-peptidase-4